MEEQIDNKKLKVLLVSSEVVPFAKSGGLGDVIGSLPKALQGMGADVRVVLPKYMSIKAEHLQDAEYVGSFFTSLSWRNQEAKILQKNGAVPVYFVENDYYFGREQLYGYDDDNERFAFFCKAVLDMLALLDFYPDVIHCNDWQTGPLCMYLKETYNKMIFHSKIKTLFTIHNLQYQGNFDKSTLELLGVSEDCFENGKIEFYGNVSYMKMGLTYGDWISTVSKTYAKEIQTQEYGYGMDGILRSRSDRLSGILNGIDYKTNNPATDSHIDQNFDCHSIFKKKINKTALQKELGLEQREVPVIGMITRLANQKGLDILTQVFEDIMKEDVQFVLLGTGEGHYEDSFRYIQQRHLGKVSANILFDDVLAQKIYAGSDMFLMPSLFEPCGLGQMFSLRYGTVPIVRKTGGLADTVSHYDTTSKTGNGFVFESYDGSGLLWAVKEALKVYRMGEVEWNHVVKNAMESNDSWEHSAKEYRMLYEELIKE